MIDIMFEFRFVSTDISCDMLFGYSEWSLFVMLDQLFWVKHFFPESKLLQRIGQAVLYGVL